MPEVETERLRLRPWRSDDLDALAKVFASELVWRYPFGHGLDREATERYLQRQQRHWEEYGFGMWAAELRATGDLIGYVGLQFPEWLAEVMPIVEVGYRLDPAVWGRGLATEAAAASLDYGFETLGRDRIIGIYEPANVASGRVMRKLGMRPWRTTHDPQHNLELEIYEITKKEWRASPLNLP